MLVCKGTPKGHQPFWRPFQKFEIPGDKVGFNDLVFCWGSSDAAESQRRVDRHLHLGRGCSLGTQQGVHHFFHAIALGRGITSGSGSKLIKEARSGKTTSNKHVKTPYKRNTPANSSSTSCTRFYYTAEACSTTTKPHT